MKKSRKNKKNIINTRRRKQRGGNRTTGQIYVFYHIFCNENTIKLVKDQITKILFSELYSIVDKIYCFLVGDNDEIVKVKEFIEYYDDKFTIAKEGPGDKTYERFTLESIKKYIKPEDKFLYIHSKGVKYNGGGEEQVYWWRTYMEYFLYTKASECIKYLDEHDIVGCIESRFLIGPHFSGNFWWSTGKYYLTLADKVGVAYHDPESYIFTGKPKYKVLDKNTFAIDKNHNLYFDKLYPKKYLNKIHNGGGTAIKFAVMAIFKNEAMCIREWVDHYKWQGLDEILLLDNNSTDKGGDLVKDVSNVTILKAPKNHAQSEMYNTIGLPWLKQNGINVLVVLDIDEYMFATDGNKLKDHIVKIFESETHPSQITCNWLMFGSSGYEKQPESVRKSFIHREKNKHVNVKSIVWVDSLEDNGISVHQHKVKGSTEKCPDVIQLNHYPIQSKEYFEKVKMKRGDVSSAVHNSVRNWDYFKEYDLGKDEVDTKLKDLVTKLH